MTNQEIRTWYQKQVSRISDLDTEWAEQGCELEERARRCWQIRHEARLQARSMMEKPAEVEDLRERDRQLYGNPDGPSFEQMAEDYKRSGLQDNEAYERIIRSAKRTNEEINWRLRK